MPYGIDRPAAAALPRTSAVTAHVEGMLHGTPMLPLARGTPASTLGTGLLWIRHQQIPLRGSLDLVPRGSVRQYDSVA